MGHSCTFTTSTLHAESRVCHHALHRHPFPPGKIPSQTLGRQVSWDCLGLLLQTYHCKATPLDINCYGMIPSQPKPVTITFAPGLIICLRRSFGIFSNTHIWSITNTSTPPHLRSPRSNLPLPLPSPQIHCKSLQFQSNYL